MNQTQPTDTKEEDSGVSEPYISQVGEQAHLHTGRLYQFTTAPNAAGEVIPGTIFELSHQAESEDLNIIRIKLKKELKVYEKFAENETEQGKMVLQKAKENIENLTIWKLEPYFNEKTKKPEIIKIKLGNSKELINAKKS